MALASIEVVGSSGEVQSATLMLVVSPQVTEGSASRDGSIRRWLTMAHAPARSAGFLSRVRWHVTCLMPRPMNAPVHPRLAITLVAAGAIVSVGCGTDAPAVHGCTGSCSIPYLAATLNLSCSATNLTNVALSGACATDSGGYYSVGGQFVDVSSPSPGVCHVELTFATGFAYSTDVTFTTPPADPSDCCNLVTAPTQATFTVNNPSTACVDGGIDAGDFETVTDAPTDAHSDASPGQ